MCKSTIVIPGWNAFFEVLRCFKAILGGSRYLDPHRLVSFVDATWLAAPHGLWWLLIEDIFVTMAYHRFVCSDLPRCFLQGFGVCFFFWFPYWVNHQMVSRLGARKKWTSTTVFLSPMAVASLMVSEGRSLRCGMIEHTFIIFWAPEISWNIMGVSHEFQSLFQHNNQSSFVI